MSPAISRDGGASLTEYLVGHRARLQAELKAAQAQFAKAERIAESLDFKLSWPMSKTSWLDWIQENQAHFEDVLRTMRNGGRRIMNQQLLPRADVPNSAPLMLPKEKMPKPPWAKLVRNGWYALKLSSHAAADADLARQNSQVVLLVVSAAKQKMAYLPVSLQGQGFEVPRNIDLAQGLKPLWEVVPAVFLAGQVSVFRLRMKVVLSDTSYWMQPTRATPVVQQPRRRRQKSKAAARPSKVNENCSSSSDSDTSSACSKESLLPDSDSDERLSFASTADASLEEAADSELEPAAPAVAAANDDESDESDRVPRAPAHTHTIWSNDYFVLTDNRNFNNLRMRIQQRWTGPKHLGAALASKTLIPFHFGDKREEPDQIILVLKAWMLHRWNGNDGKFLKRRSRYIAWERERDALAKDVKARGGRPSLHKNAIKKIELWAPSVLDA